MTRSKVKVKVTRPLKLEILQFSKSISAIFNVSWQMTSWFWNYGTMSNFCTEHIFDICPSLCVTWLRTWKDLSSVYASAIAITFARWRRRSEETVRPIRGYFLRQVRQMKTDFNYSFTVAFTNEERSCTALTLPPRLKSVAALPCEIWFYRRDTQTHRITHRGGWSLYSRDYRHNPPRYRGSCYSRRE